MEVQYPPTDVLSQRGSFIFRVARCRMLMCCVRNPRNRDILARPGSGPGGSVTGVTEKEQQVPNDIFEFSLAHSLHRTKDTTGLPSATTQPIFTNNHCQHTTQKSLHTDGSVWGVCGSAISHLAAEPTL